MAEGCEFKTTFITCYDTYEWLVLILGLTYMLSTFQKLMNSIFSIILDESLLVYLDNLLVFSADIELQYNDVKLWNDCMKTRRRQKVASVNLPLPILSTLAIL